MILNSEFFGRTMENVGIHRDTKLVTAKRRRNYLVSEMNYHTRKFFTEYLLAVEVKKMQILINKPVYLEFSMLELGKISMHEFSYNYVKPKYSEKTKLCYIDTVSLYT